MNRSRPFLAALFLVALSLAQAAHGQSGERSEIPDEVRAYALWERGYVLHLSGRYREAVDSFRESIEILPTAEGHTFLGWSLSMLGHLEEAVAECRKAIALDPDYGNPYNDIGVYLIDLGRPVEAIPWLEKAISAKRYCCYQFPHYNLGRVRLVQGDLDAARRSFERACGTIPTICPRGWPSKSSTRKSENRCSPPDSTGISPLSLLGRIDERLFQAQASASASSLRTCALTSRLRWR